MSTALEKRQAIAHALGVTKKRVVRLEALKSIDALTKAQDYELDMALHTIKLGEKLLAEQGEIK